MPKHNEIVKRASAVLAGVASYISEVQPRLDKQARADAAFSKKAEEVTDSLVAMGVVTPADARKLGKKFAENHESALDFIPSLARQIQPESMGKRASDDVSRRLEMSDDPWTRMFAEEDGMTINAMVD